MHGTVVRTETYPGKVPGYAQTHDERTAGRLSVAR
jgi:hypothetical protein